MNGLGKADADSIDEKVLISYNTCGYHEKELIGYTDKGDTS